MPVGGGGGGRGMGGVYLNNCACCLNDMKVADQTFSGEEGVST